MWFMTDQEINQKVARALGYVPSQEHPGYWMAKAERTGYIHFPLPNYCTDIKAAWEIVEWLYANKVNAVNTGCCVWKEHKRWYCGIRTENGRNYIQEYADTAPKSICLAFLKMKEAKC